MNLICSITQRDIFKTGLGFFFRDQLCSAVCAPKSLFVSMWYDSTLIIWLILLLQMSTKEYPKLVLYILIASNNSCFIKQLVCCSSAVYAI